MQKILSPNSRFFIAFVCFLGLMSCDSSAVFDEYKTVSQAWNKENIVSFNVNTQDTVSAYNLFVNIRNNNAYKFNNLFLIVDINFPNGRVLTDTLEYVMADKTGKLLGKGMSDVKESKLWYKKGVVFNETGDYVVNIQHAMRKNGEVNGVINLEGVTDIGFRIEKPLKE